MQFEAGNQSCNFHETSQTFQFRARPCVFLQGNFLDHAPSPHKPVDSHSTSPSPRMRTRDMADSPGPSGPPSYPRVTGTETSCLLLLSLDSQLKSLKIIHIRVTHKTQVSHVFCCIRCARTKLMPRVSPPRFSRKMDVQVVVTSF